MVKKNIQPNDDGDIMNHTSSTDDSLHLHGDDGAVSILFGGRQLQLCHRLCLHRLLSAAR